MLCGFVCITPKLNAGRLLCGSPSYLRQNCSGSKFHMVGNETRASLASDKWQYQATAGRWPKTTASVRVLLFASVLLIFCQAMYFMSPMKVHWSMLAHYAECGKLHGLQGSYTGEEGLLASQGCV